MSKISMHKQYALGQYNITLLTIEKPGPYPVVGYDSEGRVYLFKADGRVRWCDTGDENGGDRLVEVKPTLWVNIYPDESYSSKARADRGAGSERIACVSFKEGDGL